MGDYEIVCFLFPLFADSDLLLPSAEIKLHIENSVFAIALTGLL